MTQMPPPFQPPAPAAGPAQPAQPIYMVPPQKQKRGSGWFFRFLFCLAFCLVFFLSILMNIVSLASLAALGKAGAAPMNQTVLEEGSSKDIVAVYPLTGMITDRSASDFDHFYQMVRDDKSVKAVVVRIESGGGGVSASDEICHLVRSIREDLHKPVVVSMGGVAASGGYYVAASANEIYAEQTTITGSIGVIAMWPVFKGLMDKVGIDPVVIRSTHAEEWKARENPLEVPTPAVRKDLQDMLDTMQARFEEVVRDGRKGKLVEGKAADAILADASRPEAGPTALPTTRPAGIAPLNGKVYVADVAKKLGLVDQIGYLHDASLAAARLAGVGSPKVVRFTVRMSLMEALGSGDASRGAGGVRLDAETLDNLTAPRILMVWKP